MRVLRWALMLSAAALALSTLFLWIAAAVPDAGLFTGVGGVVFPTFGPWLVVLALAATFMAAWAVSWRILGAAVLATVLNLVLVVVFCAQVTSAGGSVDPIRALWIGPNSAQPDEMASYTTPDGANFPVAIWQPAKTAEPAPVLFYIHGGGWISGAPSNGGAGWEWFAERGWLVVSVGYQLATPNESTWDRAPAQLACALAWANEAVDRYGGDADRLVVAGDSAGGNLAVNLAYSVAAEPDTACGPTPSVRAVAVQYPVVDPIGTWNAGFSVGSDRGSDARAFLSDYVGGSPDEFPDRYRAVTSATYLDAAAPPTLVISPDHDSLIPPDGVRTFVDDARTAGIDVTRVDIPFANHAYDALATDSLGSQARLTITENWLRPYVD